MPIRKFPQRVVLDEDTLISDSAVALATQQSIKAYVDARLSCGLTWNESTDAYARTGTLAATAVGSSPGDSALSIQSRMRRCVMGDDGVIAYYLCATDSTKREDCATASDLTGADGQVMVELSLIHI